MAKHNGRLIALVAVIIILSKNYINYLLDNIAVYVPKKQGQVTCVIQFI
jgi:hypothetical protein